MKKFILLLVFTPLLSKAQRDTSFWFAVPYITAFNSPVVFRITASDKPATVLVSMPANPNFPVKKLAVSANTTTTYDFSSSVNLIYDTPADKASDYGMYFSSDNPVLIYYEVIGSPPLNPEIYTLKGKNALGKSFFAPFQSAFANVTVFSPNTSSAIDIVACEDLTAVTITPTNDILNHVANIPFTIFLNKGQTYRARANGTAANLHLGGSKIISNNLIAVTISDDLLINNQVPGFYCEDEAGDQIVPEQIVGKEYVAVKGRLGMSDKLYIIATANNTSVEINGITTSASLSIGQQMEYNLSEGAVYINCSQNCYVFQLTGAAECELSGAIIPRLLCSGSTSINYYRSNERPLYLNLLAKNGTQDNFLLNGSPGIINGSSFHVVPNTNNQYVYAQILISTTDLPVNTVATISNLTDAFQLGILAETPGGTNFGYFSDYSSLSSNINTNSPLCPGGTLLLNSTLISNANYNWTGPNGFSAITQNVSIPSASFTNSGQYKLTVTSNGCIAMDSVKVIVPDIGILTNDTSICRGSSFTVRTKSALSYKWLPTAGVSNTASPNPILSPDTTTIYYLYTQTNSGNLVLNGDFELGNNGFFTNYVYCNTGNCLFPLADNGYSIGNNATDFHVLFTGKDHTTGTGNFMVINGANPGLVVWRQTVPIQANTNYSFGTWISTLIAMNPASIRFSINGQQLGDIFSAPAAPNEWVRYFTEWNSGADTTATIEIVDIVPQASGNDFGLDDIFFSQIIQCSDSLKVTLNDISLETLPDTVSSCESAATLDAGPGFTIYKWSTGATTQTIRVSKSGWYRVSVLNSTGCIAEDSTYVLFESKPLFIDTAILKCSGQSYTLPSGAIVDSTGFYKDTLRNIHGCDSIVSITRLTFQVLKSEVLNIDLCPGQQYTLPSGRIINKAGVYSDTLSYNSGCDSIIYLINLQVKTSSQQTSNITLCNGQGYTLPWGLVVNSSGTYSDTLRYTSGCDSIYNIIKITFFESPQILTINQNICQGKLYKLPSGAIISHSGLYKDTLKNSFDCDSLITIVTLNVLSPTRITQTVSICNGQSYTLTSGIIKTASGIYTDTLKNTAGCDSLITTVDLSVTTPLLVTTTTGICMGGSYILPSGTVITTGGIYTDTLKNSAGCDSLITTLSLDVLIPTRVALNASICAGEFFQLPSGGSLSSEGIYVDTLKSIIGCDSLITTISLTVLALELTTLNASICEGQTYVLPWGASATATGVYKDTMYYTTGCDSLRTMVNLTVQNATAILNNAIICSGQSYTLPWGVIINTSGVYRDTLRYTTGCDSIRRTINLIVQPAFTNSLAAIICDGESYTLPSGRIITATGIYRDTIRYVSGCDSLLTTVNLILQKTQASNTTVAVCTGQSFTLPWGTTVNTTGIYRDTLHYSTGCDSLQQTVNLVVTPAVGTSKTATICSDEMYTLPWGAIVNTAGIYRDTVRTSTGCDSLIRTVNLSVLPIPLISITKSNDVNCTLATTRLNVSGADHYAWSPAALVSNAFISNPVAFPAKTTTFVVTATSTNGCTAKDSIEVRFSGVTNGQAYPVPSAFSPNNDGLNDCFGVPHWGYVTDFHFIIYTRYGDVVFESSNPSNCWDGLYKGKAQNTGAFIYIIKANGACGTVERKGTVMLIR